MKRGSRGLHLDYLALHERYMAGESGTAIAKELGINFAGLYRSWKRRGYPIRSPAAAAQLLHDQRPELNAGIAIATAARRGMTDSLSVREARARTREARGLGISDNERALAARLRLAGVTYRQQAAIGPYNVDFLVGDVALDVDGGGHNPRVNANRGKRRAFIEGLGYRSIAVSTRRQNWLTEAVDQLSSGTQSKVPIG